MKRRPERANEHIVPIGFRHAEDSLEAFEKIGSRELVALVKRPGKECCDAGSRGIQPFRVDFWTGSGSRVISGHGFVFRCPIRAGEG